MRSLFDLLFSIEECWLWVRRLRDLYEITGTLISGDYDKVTNSYL